jgi:hypothetical protein
MRPRHSPDKSDPAVLFALVDAEIVEDIVLISAAKAPYDLTSVLAAIETDPLAIRDINPESSRDQVLNDLRGDSYFKFDFQFAVYCSTLLLAPGSISKFWSAACAGLGASRHPSPIRTT